MYKVIMAPTEGSDMERPALDLAAELAQRFGAELRLVRVETPPVASDPGPNLRVLEITEDTVKEARAARLRQLEELAALYRARYKVPVIAALESGLVTQTLADYATESHVDLIVMCSHTRGGIKRVTLGSVADYLMRKTEIPVLLVKPSAASGEDASAARLTRIVVPLDESRFAEDILPEVSILASHMKSSIDLVHVLVPKTYSQKQMMQPGLPWWDAEIAQSKEYLEGVADRLREADLSVTSEVVLSVDVVAGILDYAAQVGADLIAITTNGAGGLGRLLFGSVADEITRKSATSLLVYHPSAVPAES
jgi:nucleotide-binding universal stress UspA family protein